MKTTLGSAVLLAVLTICAGATATADTVQLRWKLAKGETLRYRATQEQTMESEMLGEIESVNAFVFRETVTDVAADGTASLDLRYEGLRMETGGPQPMSFDSTRTGEAAKRNDPNLAKIFTPMLEAKLGMKLEPSGRVAAMTGVTEMLEAAFPSSAAAGPMDPSSMLKTMFNEDSLRKLVEINVFPAEPISPGHKWSRTVEQVLPMFGTMKLAFDNTFVGVETHAGARCARLAITGTMTLEPAKETGVPMKVSIESPTISGAMFFALDSGRLLEAQIDSVMDLKMEIGAGGQTSELEMSITSVQRMLLLAPDAPLFE